jgi:hypothetical protein
LSRLTNQTEGRRWGDRKRHRRRRAAEKPRELSSRHTERIPNQLPEIVVPLWERLASGLYVPGSVGQRIEIPADTPDFARELLPPPAPVAVLERRPSLEDQIAVRPTEADLGLGDRTTLDQLIALIRVVPFEPAMLALCRLHAMNWHIALDGRAQLEVARTFFGDIPLIERFARFLAQHENGVLFSEQEFFVIQRLLVEYAADGTLEEGMGDNSPSLAMALVGARSIVDESHAALEEGEPDAEEMIAYMVQNGAYYERRNLLNSFARAYALFVDGARATAAEPWACPLDDWTHEDLPLSLEEQFAAGFAVMSQSKALDKALAPDERPLLDLEAVFALSALKGREDDIAAVLAADRGWYADRFAERGNVLRTIAWNNTPFQQRPFIRFEDGRLFLISPRTIETWLSDGFYYRLLDSAGRRTTPRHNIVEKYTSSVGKLLERWALDVVRSVYPLDRPPGGGRAHGEQPYGNGKMTTDVAIDLGLDLVLIEVRSGYLREETRVSGDPREFADDLDRVLFRKIRQLGDRIADIVAGTAAIPDVDMSVVQRIWPIVVTANITWMELLADWVERELTAPFNDARVQKLVVLDTEDLELLIGMVESSGMSITDILASRQQGPFAKLELTRWANEDPTSPGQARPKLAEDRWQRVTESLQAVLQLPKST